MDQAIDGWVKRRRVLILGGATEDSIGYGIGQELRRRKHRICAPTQKELDVTLDPNDNDNALLEILDDFEPDSVVYSVGVNELEWSFMIDRDSFRRVMEANVWGFINVMAGLQARGTGSYSVLALTSDAAVRPMRTSMAYCASKAALNMAIKVAARELSSQGWRVNGLAPGKVAGTAMTAYVDEVVPGLRGWTPEYAAEYERASSAIGRPLTVEEIAIVACDILLSTSAAWTGDITTVNGGR